MLRKADRSILVLSYAWETNTRPDPSGRTLKAVFTYLKAEEKARGNETLGGLGLYWDALSRYKPPAYEPPSYTATLGGGGSMSNIGPGVRTEGDAQSSSDADAPLQLGNASQGLNRFPSPIWEASFIAAAVTAAIASVIQPRHLPFRRPNGRRPTIWCAKPYGSALGLRQLVGWLFERPSAEVDAL